MGDSIAAASVVVVVEAGKPAVSRGPVPQSWWVLGVAAGRTYARDHGY